MSLSTRRSRPAGRATRCLPSACATRVSRQRRAGRRRASDSLNASSIVLKLAARRPRSSPPGTVMWWESSPVRATILAAAATRRTGATAAAATSRPITAARPAAASETAARVNASWRSDRRLVANRRPIRPPTGHDSAGREGSTRRCSTRSAAHQVSPTTLTWYRWLSGWQHVGDLLDDGRPNRARASGNVNDRSERSNGSSAMPRSSRVLWQGDAVVQQSVHP